MTILEPDSIELVVDIVVAHRGGLSADRAMRLIGLVVGQPQLLVPDVVDVDEAPALGIGAVLAEPVDERSYPCDKCERSFASLGAMRIHSSRIHGSDKRPPAKRIEVAAPVAKFPQLGPIEHRSVDHQAVRDAQADAS